MATPPTFVGESEIASWTVNTSPRNVSRAVTAGDRIVVFGVAANDLTDLGTPSDGVNTYTLAQNVDTTDFCNVYVWTATAATTATLTIAITRSGATDHWGMDVLVFNGSDGFGASNKTNNASGAPSLSITTTADNSAIACCSADWNGGVITARTWRTVNSITPDPTGAANTLEKVAVRDTGIYSTYAAYWNDAGTAGAKTVGLSAPTGQKYAIVAIEIKGAAGGTTQNGAVAVAETATVTTAAAADHNASTALTATAAVASAAAVDHNATTAVSASAAVATAAAADRAASSSLAAAATVSSSAAADHNAAVALAATATLAAAAAADRAATIARTAAATVATAGAADRPGSTTLTVSVAITTDATVTGSGSTVAVAAAATLTTTALRQAMGSADIHVAAAISTAATAAFNAQAAAAWQAVITTSATVQGQQIIIPLGVTLATILDRLVSHAKATRLFPGGVLTVEPKSAPRGGLSCAFWAQAIAPAVGASGLDATTMRLEYVQRLYQNMILQPEDLIDPKMIDAAVLMMEAYSGDFELGGTAREIDLLGQFGTPLSAEAGYIPQDGKMFRCYTITIPVIVNDLLPQEA